jgi:hypothetical protein
MPLRKRTAGSEFWVTQTGRQAPLTLSNQSLIGTLPGANCTARQSFDFRAFPAVQSIPCFRV